MERTAAPAATVTAAVPASHLTAPVSMPVALTTAMTYGSARGGVGSLRRYSPMSAPRRFDSITGALDAMRRSGVTDSRDLRVPIVNLTNSSHSADDNPFAAEVVMSSSDGGFPDADWDSSGSGSGADAFAAQSVALAAVSRASMGGATVMRTGDAGDAGVDVDDDATSGGAGVVVDDDDVSGGADAHGAGNGGNHNAVPLSPMLAGCACGTGCGGCDFLGLSLVSNGAETSSADDDAEIVRRAPYIGYFETDVALARRLCRQWYAEDRGAPFRVIRRQYVSGSGSAPLGDMNCESD